MPTQVATLPDPWAPEQDPESRCGSNRPPVFLRTQDIGGCPDQPRERLLPSREPAIQTCFLVRHVYTEKHVLKDLVFSKSTRIRGHPGEHVLHADTKQTQLPGQRTHVA